MNRIKLLLCCAVPALFLSGCRTDDANEQTEASEQIHEFTVSGTKHWLYVGNKRTMVLHSIDCPEAPTGSKREYFFTVEEAQEDGYHDVHEECMEKFVGNIYITEESDEREEDQTVSEAAESAESTGTISAEE